jgi:integrase
MRIRLTDPAINRASREAAADGKRRELADQDCRGLRLRISPGGARTWIAGMRDREGAARRFTLGAYPVVGIGQAREAARAMLHAVKHGGADPVADRRRERASAEAARAGVGTLAAMLDLYERQRGGKLRSWPEYRRSIGRVFGPLLPRPLAGLTAVDLQMAADGYGAQAQASLAVRCIRPLLKWASAPGRAYCAPELAGISPPATVRRRDRVLARDELAGLLPALRASDRPYAAALRFMLLTLLRRSEADGARWQDVDWQTATLTIAAERAKNRQPHVVPLSRQALDLLRARLPDNADPAGLIFCTRTGRPLPGWDRETKRLQAASGTTGWHRHDLRRTGATMLGEMGEMPDIIEAALNHVSIRSALAATYNRARYRPQVAAALQRLGDALDGIEAGVAEAVLVE